MLATLSSPLLLCTVLLVADMIVWRALASTGSGWRLMARVIIFVAYTASLQEAGVNPLEGPTVPLDSSGPIFATILAFAWWLMGARLLTSLVGVVLVKRIGQSGRLLRDVIGAVIFVAALIAAAGYVLQLPVRGLLATSGAVAIIVGLALQSTLSDVFSGVVLNTTRPYQVNDFINIDGVEGKVVDIDWRATHLLTGLGTMAVVPNSVAAKAKIVNFSRPSDCHAVSIKVRVPLTVRPRIAIDALERMLSGTSELLPTPAAKVVIKDMVDGMLEYEAIGFVAQMSIKNDVRNTMFDLAYRHLDAAGCAASQLGQDDPSQWSRPRALLEQVKIFRSLQAEDKNRLSQSMVPVEHASGTILLDVGDVPAHMLIVGTGVVLVQVQDNEAWIEVGRMGPGEVMGEQSILTDTPSEARFVALRSCMLYRLEKDALQDMMQRRTHVHTALSKLQEYRRRSSAARTARAPAAAKKVGFLKWLQKG